MSTQKSKENSFDAIVIGSGISGGYAAMELCSKGYKTLVLERGRMVKHGEYPTANKDPWEIPSQNIVPHKEKEKDFLKKLSFSSAGFFHFKGFEKEQELFALDE